MISASDSDPKETEKSIIGFASAEDCKTTLASRTQELIKLQSDHKLLREKKSDGNSQNLPMFIGGAVFGAVMISWFLNAKDFFSRIKVSKPRRKSGRFARQSKRPRR